MKYVLALSLVYLLSGCTSSDRYGFQEPVYQKALETQNVTVKRGVTMFSGYLPRTDNYCHIEVLGTDNNTTNVLLSDEKYEYSSQDQYYYSFYIDYPDTKGYFTLEVDALKEDYIEIIINCY